jgi:hypothetical protein
MNNLSIYTLKAFRKLYAKTFSIEPLAKPECIQDAEIISQLIYDKLTSDEPCMIARFGATELMTMVNYLGVHKKAEKSILKYIKGQELDWWWNKNCLRQMEQWSGFFPPTTEKIERFCELMLKDTKEVDILGSWLGIEKHYREEIHKCIKINLELLNPYFSEKPWTIALENKKILVVHPFARSIEMQYGKRELLFDDRRILPAFELKTVRAVQSLGGGSDYSYTDWFEALDDMKSKIDRTDYDICLIGCGAYGFPLAAHVKRAGKKAVHFGGSLQLLFGIRGKRWEDPNYDPRYNYAALMNEHWIKPSEEEKPKTANNVENACYW